MLTYFQAQPGCSTCADLTSLHARSLRAAEEAFAAVVQYQAESLEAVATLPSVREELRQNLAAQRYVNDAIQKHITRMHVCRVIIAHTYEVVRLGMKAIVQSEEGFEVVAEAGTILQVLDLVSELRPQILIMDVALADQFVPTIQALRRCHEAVKFIAVARQVSGSIVADGARAGVDAFLRKAEIGSDLPRALHAVHNNRLYYSSRIAGFLANGESTADVQPVKKLSKRQQEIVQLLATGCSNKEAASRLNLSLKTIQNHRSTVMSKLQFQSFSDLVRYAIRTGLVEC